jgi:aminobenzoyl-glutamate utilization protein A
VLGLEINFQLDTENQTMIATSIKEYAEIHASKWISHRRLVHSNPELGWEEFSTTVYILEVLESLGVDFVYGSNLYKDSPRLGLPNPSNLEAAFEKSLLEHQGSPYLTAMDNGFTGVICTIQGGHDGPDRAFRCDIDALPIQESGSSSHAPNNHGFASKNPNKMHACGHDAHLAIGLGLVEVLTYFKAELSGTVRFIFQPAEEGTRGANSLIASGFADNIDEFYSLHVGVNAKEYGQLVCGWQGLLATTKLDVSFFGRASHAAIAPHEGVDALAAACHAVVSLKAALANLPPSSRINVGILKGGVGRNVVAPHAHFQMETRSFDQETHTKVDDRVMSILEGSAKAFSATYKVDLVGRTEAGCSDSIAATKIQNAAQGMGEWHNIELLRDDFCASDDAASWMQYVQSHGGIATYVGLGTPTKGGHHNPLFDIDERVIPSGVELFARLFLTRTNN